jgi:hypothetical protein
LCPRSAFVFPADFEVMKETNEGAGFCGY